MVAEDSVCARPPATGSHVKRYPPGANSISDRVRRTTAHVAAQAREVSINESALSFFSEEQTIQTDHWMSASPVQFEDLAVEDELGVVFAFNAVSYSYWGSPKWSFAYRGCDYDGSWGMLAALRAAIHNRADALRPERLADLREHDLAVMLGGLDRARLLHFFSERLDALNEVGRAVLGQHDGRYFGVVEKADGETGRLLQSIESDLPSFSDVTSYAGEPVAFYKRAQLLAADIHWVLSRRTGEGLRGWETLTSCADYKIPQILRFLGLIEYSPRLSALVDNELEIASGSADEAEIRACTVQAVEHLVGRLRLIGRPLAAMELNDYFWLAAQRAGSGLRPYHRTRTRFY